MLTLDYRPPIKGFYTLIFRCTFCDKETIVGSSDQERMIKEMQGPCDCKIITCTCRRTQYALTKTDLVKNLARRWQHDK